MNEIWFDFSEINSLISTSVPNAVLSRHQLSRNVFESLPSLSKTAAKITARPFTTSIEMLSPVLTGLSVLELHLDSQKFSFFFLVDLISNAIYNEDRTKKVQSVSIFYCDFMFRDLIEAAIFDCLTKKLEKKVEVMQFIKKNWENTVSFVRCDSITDAIKELLKLIQTEEPYDYIVIDDFKRICEIEFYIEKISKTNLGPQIEIRKKIVNKKFDEVDYMFTCLNGIINEFGSSVMLLNRNTFDTSTEFDTSNFGRRKVATFKYNELLLTGSYKENKAPMHFVKFIAFQDRKVEEENVEYVGLLKETFGALDVDMFKFDTNEGNVEKIEPVDVFVGNQINQ